MSLKGKKAIVTGGSRGIGAAIARQLAAEGADVAITYAGNREGAEVTVAAIEKAGARGFAFQADAANSASQQAGIEQAAAALGGIDILVQNAGVAAFSTLDTDTDDAFDRMFDTNVKGLNVGLRTALPHLGEGGRVILIGSVVADKGFAANGIYSGTKGAVKAMGRAWALELAPRGILVNVVQPGATDTDMNPADGEFARQVTSMVPLGRYGRPEEIANAVTFLASDKASYITGTTLNVDGGVTV
ncbi:SDR family NAD(P)-dependent oxidoreductase [Sphingomonas aracearum]|uniref:3-oxoacyl-ACP reductase FabG n=1 Tax=Sphingomonas aracearum TaxID=2283317 RepID=A0A369VZ17_9SPHN|nr:3-oxoacyl-ACP reductase family protein [Sphingomonas aracearum]RDE06865.1 3-oxoacyl-ACP reductase FabG [Sphingomonas aracearum]